jgi:hypothetical protein
MEHSIIGEKSWHLDSYKLSATDTDKSKRNFPGYEKKQYYNLGDIQKGDHHLGRGGMTETDSKTSGKDDGPYTSIQEKGQKSRWPVKSSASGKE